MNEPNYPRTTSGTFAFELRPGPTSGLPCLYRIRLNVPGAGWELLLSCIPQKRAEDFGFTLDQWNDPSGAKHDAAMREQAENAFADEHDEPQDDEPAPLTAAPTITITYRDFDGRDQTAVYTDIQACARLPQLEAQVGAIESSGDYPSRPCDLYNAKAKRDALQAALRGVFPEIPAPAADHAQWTFRTGCAPHFQGQIYDETTGATVAISYNDETGTHARLMAAAPDLLAALDRLQSMPNDPRAHRQAFDAIAKARA